MPLVVPGLMTSGSNNAKSRNNNNEDDNAHTNEAWMNKLLGKKLTDASSDETTFSKTDLPKNHRILGHDSMQTQDYVPDRLNIFLAQDGTVAKTQFDDGRN